MSSNSSSQEDDVIENRKSEICETAESVPAGMEAAVVEKLPSQIIYTCNGDPFPPIYLTTTAVTTIPTVPNFIGPGNLIAGDSGRWGAELDSADSDVSVRSSADDLVEAHDRSD